jgi:hypothetical protein
VYFYRAGSHSSSELKDPLSVAEIESFVRKEISKPFFHVKKMNSENIHATWIEKPNQPKFVLLVSSNSAPHSLHFQKLLRRSVKNDTDCQVHLIDVDFFPGMADYFRHNFKVDSTGKPLLGFVALHNSTGIWLTERQLNTTAGKEADRQNEKVIADFIGQILNGSVTFHRGLHLDKDSGIPVINMDLESDQGVYLDVGAPVDLRQLRADIVKSQNGDLQSEDRFDQYSRTEAEPGDQSDYRTLNVVANTRHRSPTESTHEAKVTKENSEEDPIHKFEHDLTTFGEPGNTYKRERLEF